jgi:vitamin B12 transporter
MKMKYGFRFAIRAIFALLIFALTASPLLASSAATIGGTITDTLGAAIQNATVELVEIDTGKAVQTTNSDAGGRYSFTVSSQGRFRIRAQAASFQPAASDEKFVAGARPVEIDLTLSPSVVAQQIVVTATGVSTPEVQTGASIGVIGEQSLATRRAVEEELRIEPGAQVTSTGQVGAVTSLYVRGGPSDANQVIIDGVPADDIGGAVNFANLSAGGYEKAELYRGPNSALFGSGAYADVLDIVTRRGVTPLPELGYAIDGGTFGTLHQEANLGGAWRRFDYFTDFNRFGTQNSTPNSEFHNASYLANLGWQLLPNTVLRATVRRSVSAFNAANAVALYGIPDDGVSREHDTAFGASLENRPNPSWHNLLNYSGLRLRSEYTNGGPTGICYDPGDPACNDGFQVYLGDVVTIRGANGYQVTGQGILQFAPGAYATSTLSDRDSVYAQSDYRFNSALAALFAFRYDAEGGYTNDGFAKSTVERRDTSYMMQLNGGLRNRLFYTAGAGLETSSIFGFAASPRASLAYYIAKPRDQGILSGTRLVFNFGKGIKEPSIYYETNSLFDLLQSIGAPGQTILAQYPNIIHPFLWSLSRTYDGGVQQTLLHGKARLSITYFHNEFGDQAEFVPLQGLAELGVPQSVITALGADIPGGFFGATANTLSYSAQGAEVEAEYHITHNLSVRGGWTYTDTVVQHSFSSDALAPSINPAFPNIPIGAYGPLVGARPFHIAPHTGYFSVDWTSGRCSLRMTGSLVSRRDDSDFLQDSSYGTTMLLPNRNLDPAYQRLDLFGSFRIARRVRAYASMENLLNQRYYEAFGYPALPFTIRSGVEFKFGGESWKF